MWTIRFYCINAEIVSLTFLISAHEVHSVRRYSQLLNTRWNFVLLFKMSIPWPSHVRGSPIGLAGCGIWQFFTVIFGVWAENWVGNRNYNYEQEWDFMFLWGWDAEFSRRTEQDTGFEFLREPQAGRNEPFVHIAVSDFNFWIAMALYPVRFCQTYRLLLDYI